MENGPYPWLTRLTAFDLKAVHPFAAYPWCEGCGCRGMATNQLHLPDDEILTQAAARKLMGVTRAKFRGFLDRGEIRAVDYLGARDSARVAGADVRRLMSERGLPTPTSDTPRQAEPMCSKPECVRARGELQRVCSELTRRTEAHTRTRRALVAATE